MATVTTGSLSLGVHRILAQTSPATPVVQEATWVDLAGSILKGIGVVFGVGGAGKIFSNFWGRDRDEGERSRNRLLDDKDAQIERLQVEVDDLRTMDALHREEILELRTRVARYEALEQHRATDHGIPSIKDG